MNPSRLEQLEAMLAEDPGDRELQYFLATEYLQVERFEDCLARIDRYLATGDDEGVGFRMRGVCLFRLGRGIEARTALLQGIEAARRHHHADLASDIQETLDGFFPSA